MSYEVPSDARRDRKTRIDIDRNRNLAKFSPTYSTQASEASIGNAIGGSAATGVRLGSFVMNPELHTISIELSWTSGTGDLKIGDIVDTTATAWQGKFLHLTSGTSTAGRGVFEPQNTTVFTDVAQTLSVSGGWSATYTTGTDDNDRIVMQSASAIVQDITGANPTISTILGVKNDGQFTTLKPIETKTLTMTSGGNIDTTIDVTVEDDTYSILQFFEDNITPDADGSWSISSGGGGVAGTIIITPTNEVTSPGASEDVDLSLFQHYIFHLSANLELTLINPPTTINRAEQFILEFIQDGVGSRTITVTNTIHPSVPVLDGTANSRSVIVGFALNDLGNNKRFDMYLVGS